MFKEIRQKLRQIDALQEKSNFVTRKTDEQHTCAHCQTEYVGYTCPQCGMRADSERFTFKSLLPKLMDMIGFDEHGNRSIIRTLRDLFWRPGYMIRDYLNGHSAAYFQPFKLLFLLVIIFTLLIHIMGIEPHKTLEMSDFLKRMEEDETKKALLPFMILARDVIQWFRNNVAYSVLIQNVFVVTAMWKVYRKRSPYSWTETFIAQMYICCQFMLLAIIQVLLTWKYHASGLLPYFVQGWVVIPFMLYDFYQFYGEQRFLPAVWRVIKVLLWLLIQYASLFVLLIVVLVIFVAITKSGSINLNF